ncbi:MAG: homoserine kinase [Candidatus Neomarinimicrobiota bacterium]
MKTKRICAYAPASIGNVSVGFDCLGLALEQPGDYVSIEKGKKPGVELIEINGDGGVLPKEAEKNVVGVVIQKMLDDLNRDDALAIRLVKGLALQSGMGSSASSSVAAAVAANAYLGSPFTKEELLPYAMEGERVACGAAHADNVAPALLGGITLIRSHDPIDVIKLDYPKNLYCAVVHPELAVATRDARAVLPKTVPLETAVAQSAHLAAFVVALYQSKWDLLSRSMVDMLAEPNRKELLAYFDEVKDAGIKAGALACGISGSGPTIFALCRGKVVARRVAIAMSQVYDDHEIDNQCYVSKVNSKGAEII